MRVCDSWSEQPPVVILTGLKYARSADYLDVINCCNTLHDSDHELANMCPLRVLRHVVVSRIPLIPDTGLPLLQNFSVKVAKKPVIQV